VKTFPLSLVAACAEFLNFEVISVSVPGEAGQLGVMANHLPIIVKLGVGLVHVITANKEEKWFGVTGGFFEMMGDHATLLADEIITPKAAEFPEYLKGKPLYIPSEFVNQVQRSDFTKALLRRKLSGATSKAAME